jgi:preprotein translocase subunit SecA
VRTEEEIEREELERQRRLQARMQLQHAPPPELAAPAPAPLQGGPEAEIGAGAPGRSPVESAAPFVRTERKVGRNEPCPCGSGRKFKHCHGALQRAGG